jgi:cardiolipin synthase
MTRPKLTKTLPLAGLLAVLLTLGSAPTYAKPKELTVSAPSAEVVSRVVRLIGASVDGIAFVRRVGRLGDIDIKRMHIRAALSAARLAGIDVPQDLSKLLESTIRIEVKGSRVRFLRSEQTTLSAGPLDLRLEKKVQFRVKRKGEATTVHRIKGLKIGASGDSLYPLRKIGLDQEGGAPSLKFKAGGFFLFRTWPFTKTMVVKFVNAPGASDHLDFDHKPRQAISRSEIRRVEVARLKGLLAGPMGEAARTRALQSFARLDEAGLLESGLRQLETQGHATADNVAAGLALIRAELWLRGLSKSGADQNYESLDEIGRRQRARIAKSKVKPQGPGHPSAFENETFVRELEKLSGAKFTSDNVTRPLIDGPESFALRDKLIDGAQRSVNLMSWAIYDDSTGWETAKRLVRAQERGVKVRVIVDGKMSRMSNFNPVVEFLEKQGVAVLRWNDSARPYDGTHRKMLGVDGDKAIAGGMNIGDHYSHRGPADSERWRDTDVYVEGPAAVEMNRLFASVWNSQSKWGQRMRVQKPKREKSAKRGGGLPLPRRGTRGRVAVVDHVPGSDANIMLATMKAIRGSTSSVDIEQGYFMELPGLQGEIKAALARGVRVRILANSPQSLKGGDAVMSRPIMASLGELADLGAEIYVKKGAQLHSKFMIVDGIYTSVGSWNPHPRSLRLEGEMTVNTLDANTASNLTKAFEKDLTPSQARRIRTGAEIKLPENKMSRIAMLLFPNQL